MAKEKVTEIARSMPNNLEAEQAVLGCILIDSESAVDIISKINEDDFYSETHKGIYEAIRALYDRNVNIDIITLTDELDKKGSLASVGGVSYLTTLTNVVPSSANYENYVKIIKRDSVLRQLIESCSSVISKAYQKDNDEDVLAYAEKNVYEIAEKGQTSSLERINVPLQNVIDRLEDIQRDPASLRGLTTGFYKLDELLNGLHRSDLVIIAARPGIGKTSLAMNIVVNAALEAGAKCACFSLEMSAEQLAQRMLFSVANVDMGKGMKGELDQVSDWTKLWKANKKLRDTQIYIDQSSLNTPSKILSKCRKLKRERGLDLVMIDYLQLMSGDGKFDNRQAEVSNISRNLKILAKEIDVPVIVACQLSRQIEQRTSHRPVLSDLRESGAIEQDADIVMFIHKKEMYNAEGAPIAEDNANKDYEAELIIAKHRAGKLGSVFLGWKGSRVSFVNLEHDANTKSIIDAYTEGHMPKAEDIKESGVNVTELPPDEEIF
ncbi:MAG: replicative DNA helicase [Clostridia bacterium]|nr:replicative DNA helicase [Clostridia bacterium]